MSPILVRPVREQLEHDRVIRLLQAKYKRKFEVAINPGNEQNSPVVSGPSPWYPDLVLQSTDKTHKLLGVVEVETTESINHLEAMSQWGTFSRLKVQFHLYVPLGGVDSARRLCSDLQIATSEIWAYQAVGDQIRFTMVHRTPQPGDSASAGAVSSAARPAAARPEREPKVAAPPAARNRPAAAPARPAPSARPSAAGRTATPRARTAAAPAARPSAARPTRRPATAEAGAPARRAATAKAKAPVPGPRRATAKPAPKPAPRSSSRATKRR